jgi:hypothetical protein
MSGAKRTPNPFNSETREGPPLFEQIAFLAPMSVGERAWGLAAAITVATIVVT